MLTAFILQIKLQLLSIVLLQSFEIHCNINAYEWTYDNYLGIMIWK